MSRPDERPAVLPYEQSPEPPCVVRSPGRVALLLPPPPRWVMTVSVVILAAVWAVSVAMAIGVVVLIVRRGLPLLDAPPAAVFFLAAPVVLTWTLGYAVLWWARVGRVGGVLEVAGGELRYSLPGVWWPTVRRAALSRVRDVRFTVNRGPGQGEWVRVDVRVKVDGNWGAWVWRYFYTQDGGLAEEAQRAFGEALGRVAPGGDEK